VASWSLILAALVVGITICVAIGYIVFLQPNPESNVPDLPPSDAVVETPPPFLPDIQCVDDDVVCLRHIFAKKSVDEGARSRLILPRRGHYVQDTHDIALRLYCG
jgi:hypothetical protein